LKTQLSILKAAFWLMLLLSANAALCATDTTLTTDTRVSTEGYFVLAWSSDPASHEPLELQEADSADFARPTALEIAPTGSITLTGYADGRYFFRAGRAGNWSDTLQVEVRHHALSRAFAFFALGLLLFAILVTVILRGSKLQGGEPH
jgi:hypothetical protein